MRSTEGDDAPPATGPGGPSRHPLRVQEALWNEVLELARTVESSLATAVQALCEERVDLAAEVQDRERTIDRWEVRIERECLRILALYEPVASDHRRMVVILKLIRDLERLGDLAAHIAKRARRPARGAGGAPVADGLRRLATDSLEAVRNALAALARGDAELARSVIAGDRKIDRQRRDLLRLLKASLRAEPERLGTWFRLINTARNLERSADHATNIAEAVIFLKQGEIIRHSKKRPRPAPTPGADEPAGG